MVEYPRRVVVVALMVLGAAAAACGGGPPEAEPAPTGVTSTPAVTPSEPAAAATVEATPERTGTVESTSAAPRVAGIAGLVPPNFPDSSDADWLTFFTALPGLGGTVGNYAPLADLERNQAIGLAAGVDVLPVTGFHQDQDGGIALTVDFADPAQTEAYIEGLVAFALLHRPPFLGVGNEVNRVWEEHPDAFEAWLAALPAIVDAVHEASPETAVFATFQYEFLRGDDDIAGGVRAADWTPLEGAAPHLDAVGYTTYPYFARTAPEDIPTDYYREAAERAGKPVGFTEIGWPSAAIASLEGSAVDALGGTEDEQTAFIERLPLLFEDVEPLFAMWVWAYDTPAVGPLFDSLGLHDVAGAPKPALDAWRAFLAGRSR